MSTTLITGASSGIGEAFANRLAASGDDLFLVSRSEERLMQICNELGRAHGVSAHHMPLDLRSPDAPQMLFEETQKRGLIIDTLINNAGVGVIGDFLKSDLARQLEMIDLNVKALVALTYLYLESMRERKRGTIINIASTAAYQPVPHMTTYAATKAFVLSFSIALWEENRKHGVRVMAVCPGVTRTNFFEAANTALPVGRVIQTADQVVETALQGLKHNRSHVISGWSNYLMIESERLAPRSIVARVAGKSMRSAYAIEDETAKAKSTVARS